MVHLLHAIMTVATDGSEVLRPDRAVRAGQHDADDLEVVRARTGDLDAAKDGGLVAGALDAFPP